MTVRHEEPSINAFLADGDYDSIEEWALDSDYELVLGEWCDDLGNPVGALEGVIEGAMESCGFLEEYYGGE